jgi:hypothetical protein
MVSYFKRYNYIGKKHFNAKHGLIVKTFEDKVNIKTKNPMESQPTKKNHAVSLSAISNFVRALNLFKKDNVQQKLFLENLGILVVKSNFHV